MNATQSELSLTPRLVPTIFHEHWWLEIACDGAYAETTVTSGGVVVGRLPYLLSNRHWGLKTIGMPLMTHVLGPALAAEFNGSNSTHPLKHVSIVRDLVAQLPRASHVYFRLHGALTNTLGFEAAGFANNVSFTIEVPPESSEVLWRQMRDKTRNVIRRAQERLRVVSMADPKEFLLFYEANLRARGLKNHYCQRTCLRILQECLERGVGMITATVDPRGEMQSAIFTIWDHRAEYYFMSTRTLQSMSGATSLAIWTAMQHAASKGLTFDMDGVHVINSTLPNLQLLTGFGGSIKPRYGVRRTSPILRLAHEANMLLGAVMPHAKSTLPATGVVPARS